MWGIIGAVGSVHGDWGLLGALELRGTGRAVEAWPGGYWEGTGSSGAMEGTGSTGSTGAGRQLNPSTGGVLGGNWGRDTAQSHHWGVLGVLAQGDSPVPSLGVTGRALGHGHSPVPALEV